MLNVIHGWSDGRIRFSKAKVCSCKRSGRLHGGPNHCTYWQGYSCLLQYPDDPMGGHVYKGQRFVHAIEGHHHGVPNHCTYWQDYSFLLQYPDDPMVEYVSRKPTFCSCNRRASSWRPKCIVRIARLFMLVAICGWSDGRIRFWKAKVCSCNRRASSWRPR